MVEALAELDVYREAGERGLGVQHVEVEPSGDFGAEGEPARDLDLVAEIDQRPRGSTAGTLERVEVVPPPVRG